MEDKHPYGPFYNIFGFKSHPNHPYPTSLIFYRECGKRFGHRIMSKKYDNKEKEAEFTSIVTNVVAEISTSDLLACLHEHPEWLSEQYEVSASDLLTGTLTLDAMLRQYLARHLLKYLLAYEPQ